MGGNYDGRERRTGQEVREDKRKRREESWCSGRGGRRAGVLAGEGGDLSGESGEVSWPHHTVLPEW